MDFEGSQGIVLLKCSTFCWTHHHQSSLLFSPCSSDSIHLWVLGRRKEQSVVFVFWNKRIPYGHSLICHFNFLIGRRICNTLLDYIFTIQVLNKFEEYYVLVLTIGSCFIALGMLLMFFISPFLSMILLGVG
jgi:hypothetical protein